MPNSERFLIANNSEAQEESSLKKEERLDVCKSTRIRTAKALFTALYSLLEKNDDISEAALRNNWIEELNKEKDISNTGWYSPPPHGIGILFGNENDNKRLNFDSLRKENNWPSENIFLSKEKGIIYAYASPVNKNNYIAGDFGTILYFGSNEEMKKNLKTSLKISRDIFKEIKIGQKLSDIYKIAQKIIFDTKSINKNANTTFKAGENIGHTIPHLKEDQINELKLGKKTLSEIISSERLFISNTEESRISGGTILTLEPRLIINSNLPMISYHMVCLIHQNHIELLENFNDLFQLAGMNYIF